MSQPQWLAAAPFLIVAASAVVVTLVIAIKRQPGLIAFVSMAGLALALGWLCVSPLGSAGQQTVTALLVLDPFARFYMAIILVAALVVAALAHSYLQRYRGRHEEMYLLLLLSALGGMVMAASRHFASLFVGLELLSMPMYGMAAYLVKERRSLEAGLKYLVLSAVASAFVLFGMALVYSQSGTMLFNEIGARVVSSDGERLVILLGAGLLLTGLGFKLSLAPFHLWTPDVYEGAPAPVAAFLATASKIAVLALLQRYFIEADAYRYRALLDVLTLLAMLSIVVGNVLALRQLNLKRLLAYSAIAQFGYVLVALISSGPLAGEAVGIYLLTYALTTLAAFGVITLTSSPYADHENQQLADFRGLYWRRPGLAVILTLALLSLAGVPLTPGFLGKFYALGTGVDMRQWLLVAAIVAGSAVGLYYYLRALIQLYLRPESPVPVSSEAVRIGSAGGSVLIALLIGMLALGFYPAPFIKLARTAAVSTTPTASTSGGATLVSR
jgi:NADH-quinone oxidoreductase subunit N